MRERKALLAAVCETPEDDAPRQVFADWCEEHGEPQRAEFIRLQLRLAAMEEDDPAREAPDRRETELWAAHHKQWQAEIPRWPGVKTEGRFRRGFAESACFTAAAFVKYGEAVARHIPLRAVTFEKLTAAGCVKVAAAPTLARVKNLSLYSHKVGDKGARALFASPHLGGLAELKLTSTGITGEVMADLARAPGLKNLEKLALSDNALHDSGLADLAAAEGWKPLRAFDGYRMGLSEGAAEFFADAPLFARLEELELSGNWLGDAGVSRLVRGRGATWRSLDLSRNEIGDDGAEALAASPRAAKLRKLEIEENAIGVRGVRALAGSRYLKGLRELNLNGNAPFGDAGAKAIAASRNLKRLVNLDLSEAASARPAWRRW